MSIGCNMEKTCIAGDADLKEEVVDLTQETPLLQLQT